MKKIIYIFITSLLYFLLLGQSYAIDSKVSSLYGEFIKKIQTKHGVESQQQIYKELRDQLSEYSYKTLSSSKQKFLGDMISLNNEMLYEGWLSEELTQSSQKLGELKERLALERKLKKQIISQNILNLTKSSKREYIAIDENREFVKDGAIYTLEYSKYFSVEDNPAAAIESKTGVIIPRNSGGYALVEDYSFNKKIPYSELGEQLLGFLTPTYKILLKDGYFHAYNFQNVRFFDDSYGIYQAQLDNGGFKNDSTFLYYDEEGRYNLVTDFTSHKLVKSSDIFGVTDKHLILDYLREDSKYPSQNTSQSILDIQKIAEDITRGKSKEEQIKAIYNWVLENISYSSQVNLSNQKIFSAIETFNNSNGVCTGYTKLSAYLFLFAGIHDAQVVRGHVIDAADFPQIGHAWVRIGDRYYDPTFDDPIGAQETKRFDEYKYFGLPKDIFYANRFDYETLPENFKTLSESQIQQYIFNYLTKLLPKYQSQIENYKVFAPIEFRNKYNIAATTTLTPELLASKIGSYKLEANSFKFVKDGKKQSIAHIKYYPLTTENTKRVLDIVGYDTKNYTLFDWELSDGQREWRLAYELELR